MPSEEKLTKKEQEIKKQAKRILDKFAGALEGIKEGEEHFVEREKDRREEGNGMESDEEFRKIFFENAPKKDKDFILGEKGDWK